MIWKALGVIGGLIVYGSIGAGYGWADFNRNNSRRLAKMDYGASWSRSCLKGVFWPLSTLAKLGAALGWKS